MTQTLYSDSEERGMGVAGTAQKTLSSQSLVVSDSRRHVATRRGVDSFEGGAAKTPPLSRGRPKRNPEPRCGGWVARPEAEPYLPGLASRRTHVKRSNP
jgi:hypothetical protein